MVKRRNSADQLKAEVALEALRGDRTIQEIAARPSDSPQAVEHVEASGVEGMADMPACGGRPESPTEAEVRKLHAGVGRLAVGNDVLSAGLK